MRKMLSLLKRACGLRCHSASHGFTLIELLVVIAIISVLAAILFPVFASTKQKAWQSNCQSNLRQLGSAVQMYAMDCGGYPRHSSPSSTVPRTRWADYIYSYVKNDRMFICPSTVDKAVLTKQFAHNQASIYGGYGYNYQYLGNARDGVDLPFTANDSMIVSPSFTVAIADTDGCLNPDGTISGDGNYVVDPPLESSRGSGRPTGYYGQAGLFANGGRSMVAERHNGIISVAFADGHVKAMKRSRLDDLNNDGIPDNGFWNGRRDPNWR